MRTVVVPLFADGFLVEEIGDEEHDEPEDDSPTGAPVKAMQAPRRAGIVGWSGSQQPQRGAVGAILGQMRKKCMRMDITALQQCSVMQNKMLKLPLLGRSSPAKRRSTVDLPAPEGPTTTSCSPGSMLRSTPLRMVRLPQRTLKV